MTMLPDSGILVNFNFIGGGTPEFKFNGDYSAFYTDRSIVDKAYVDSAAATGAGNYWPLGGSTAATGNVYIDATSNVYEFFWEWPEELGLQGGGGLQINTGINIGTWLLGTAGAQKSSIDFYDGEINIISTVANWPGMLYGADHTANFGTRSIIDRGFADANYWKVGSNTQISSNIQINIDNGNFLQQRTANGNMSLVYGDISSNPILYAGVINGSNLTSQFGLDGSGGVAGVAGVSVLQEHGSNSTIQRALTVGGQVSSGGAADGYGAIIVMTLESSTTNWTEVADLQWSWVTAAHATRRGKLSIGAYNVAAREEFIVMTGNGNLDLYAPNGIITADKALQLKSYTVTGAPSPTGIAGAMIYVTDETGGAVPAFSDGTNWRRVTDRAIIA
jgi:hypothetical protein